jgi:hypothetical protein
VAADLRVDRGQCVGRLRARLLAHGGEERVGASGDAVLRGQPVPGRHQVGCGSRRGGQRLMLVLEQAQRALGVELRIVQLPAGERGVLIVLHQVVVRVARKGERTEPQRVDVGQLQQLERRIDGSQVRAVEGDQVVAEQERRAVRQCVEALQRGAEVAAGIGERVTGIAADRGEAVNAAVLPAHLEIDAEVSVSPVSASGREGCRERGWRHPWVRSVTLSVG